MITPVITSRELILAVTAGSVLILFSLVPSLFQGLAEGVRQYIEAFHSPFPGRVHRHEPIRTPSVWLAAFGVALIVISALSYTAGN